MSEKKIFKNSSFVVFIWRGLLLLQLKQEKGVIKYHPCGGKSEPGESSFSTVNRERKEEITFSRDIMITQENFLFENKLEIDDLDAVWLQKFYFFPLNDADIQSMIFGDVQKWVLINQSEIKNFTLQNSTFAMLAFAEFYRQNKFKNDDRLF